MFDLDLGGQISRGGQWFTVRTYYANRRSLLCIRACFTPVSSTNQCPLLYQLPIYSHFLIKAPETSILDVYALTCLQKNLHERICMKVYPLGITYIY